MSNFQFSWPILGQENIQKFLQTSIKNDHLAQAYLFYGPALVGKTALAKVFAQSIICEQRRLFNRHQEVILPCQTCLPCRQFKKGVYSDFYVLERELAESGRKKGIIGVREMRELLERINKRAFFDSYKIIFIPEAEKLNAEASNCLLKNLEEPSGRTIFILVTLHYEMMLPTILSRVQALRCAPIAEEKIRTALLQQGADRNLAMVLSRVALGRGTIAQQLLTDQAQYQVYQQERRQALSFFKKEIKTNFQLIDHLLKDYRETNELLSWLDALAVLARDAIFIALSRPEAMVNGFLHAELTPWAQAYSCRQWREFILKIERAKHYILSNVSPRLVLENLALSLI